MSFLGNIVKNMPPDQLLAAFNEIDDATFVQILSSWGGKMSRPKFLALVRWVSMEMSRQQAVADASRSASDHPPR